MSSSQPMRGIIHVQYHPSVRPFVCRLLLRVVKSFLSLKVKQRKFHHGLENVKKKLEQRMPKSLELYSCTFLYVCLKISLAQKQSC